MHHKSSEDKDDLRAFAERANEPTVPFEKVKGKLNRDIEKVYSTDQFVAKLRRLADALEKGEKFEIQIAGERIYVPVRSRVQYRARTRGRRRGDRISDQMDEFLTCRAAHPTRKM